MQFRIQQFLGRRLGGVFAVLLVAACSGGSGADQASAGAAGEAQEASSATKPIRISQGAEVDIREYAVAGEFTVFDFMSDYCPPCQRIAPWMDRLHNEREGVTVVKVDINRPGVRGIDWQSPVAAQYRLSSIPHFKVVDADGKLVAEGDQAWQMLVAWLEQLPVEGGSGQS